VLKDVIATNVVPVALDVPVKVALGAWSG